MYGSQGTVVVVPEPQIHCQTASLEMQTSEMYLASLPLSPDNKHFLASPLSDISSPVSFGLF